MLFHFTPPRLHLRWYLGRTYRIQIHGDVQNGLVKEPFLTGWDRLMALKSGEIPGMYQTQSESEYRKPIYWYGFQASTGSFIARSHYLHMSADENAHLANISSIVLLYQLQGDSGLNVGVNDVLCRNSRSLQKMIESCWLLEFEMYIYIWTCHAMGYILYNQFMC